MQIKIDFTKSAQDNADDYYKKAKRLAQKKLGAEKAIKMLEKRMASSVPAPAKNTAGLRKMVSTQKEWYEKFHWFFTSDGMLAVGGRDARQNELLNSRHFENGDLFFHANIFGASAVILKNGERADAKAKEETAQFAACYSSAWKESLPIVDVYAMKREQVSKSTAMGAISTGSFVMKGEREWYRGITLSLVFFVKEGRLNAVPEMCFYRMKEKGGASDSYVLVKEGRVTKSDAAKSICRALGYGSADIVMQQLPAGAFSVNARL
ncbi:NFACT RNA binding domain-containing protein [Candidatus Marsarchaeota archaeon]|jgi:predicted ribosome quality control (RQC) complex YloA/Tae2 family protein|nr:NFACT RNA binding domain-containing protein [Candidatus Marsarchaeota archaeon]